MSKLKYANGNKPLSEEEKQKMIPLDMVGVTWSEVPTVLKGSEVPKHIF